MKATELLESQNLSSQQDKQNSTSEELIKTVNITGTPFTGVKYSDVDWKIAIGKFIVSDKQFENYEELENYVMIKPWELVFNGVMAYMQIIENIKNQN